jgi:transcription antitermination factor NusG
MSKLINKLIIELQALQIRQQEVTEQLVEAKQKQEKNNDNTQRITARKERLDTNSTQLEIGDKVKLLTSGLFQDTEGKVTKFGKNRVTITLKNSGQKTTRKSNNLLLLEE